MLALADHGAVDGEPLALTHRVDRAWSAAFSSPRPMSRDPERSDLGHPHRASVRSILALRRTRSPPLTIRNPRCGSCAAASTLFSHLRSPRASHRRLDRRCVVSTTARLARRASRWIIDSRRRSKISAPRDIGDDTRLIPPSAEYSTPWCRSIGAPGTGFQRAVGTPNGAHGDRWRCRRYRRPPPRRSARPGAAPGTRPTNRPRRRRR